MREADKEIDALERIITELLTFPPDAQSRMLTYIVRRITHDNTLSFTVTAAEKPR